MSIVSVVTTRFRDSKVGRIMRAAQYTAYVDLPLGCSRIEFNLVIIIIGIFR